MDFTEDIAPPLDFYGPGDIGRNDSLAGLMKSVIKSITQEVDRCLAAHDLTNAQWVPLLPLAQGRCESIVELARFGGSDAGAMTRTVGRLEAKGLVERLRSIEDRRVIRLNITDAGRTVAAVVPGVVAEVLNRRLAGFTMEEWRRLLDMLRRMQANGKMSTLDEVSRAPTRDLPPG